MLLTHSATCKGLLLSCMCALTACADDLVSSGGAGGMGSSASSTVSAHSAVSGTGGGAPLSTKLVASMTSSRFTTADHMRAAIEMQISGEPFAELLGRDLAGYDRFSNQTDVYVDPRTGMSTNDPLGWSLAIESYEYSKQPMNNLSFESGAGLSLQYGPRLNPTGLTGDPAFTLLLGRIQALGVQSRASGAVVGKDFVTTPAPTNDPTNYYGWPGFNPVFAEYRSFATAIAPSVGADHQCSLAGATDEPLPPGTVVTFVGDYECDYNSLNLPDRDAAVEKVIEPAALGYAVWKQGLWVVNYWSSAHDGDQHPIVAAPSAQYGQIGLPDNTVIGQWPDPTDPTGTHLVFGKAGTYLGDVSLEGFQGLVMLDEMDNKSTFLLEKITTHDGATLGGFGSLADAVDYDYASPLRYWPAAIQVHETTTAPTAAESNKYFPSPDGFTIEDGSSRLVDLNGLIGGYSEAYAMTDATNPDIGGTMPFLATFDGSPYEADNGLPDGEDTLHDRSLGILKVGIVDLDRLHFDSTNQVLVDASKVDATGVVTRGTTVSTLEAGYAIVSLRTARRSLEGSLVLYSNDTPDPIGMPDILDATSLGSAPFQGSFGDRIGSLIRAEGDFISDHLLDASGLAHNGFDLVSGQADGSPTTIESQAAAIRGLLDAYLATSNEKYRARAVTAYGALEKTFWMGDIRAYRTTAGESSTMTWTPRAFGTLHGALRQFYKLYASSPGNDDLAAAVLARIVRQMKLVVNGFNDENQNGVVDAGECLGARLEMAERALTGEFSIASDQGDRDHDCVPDIASAHLPAALADQIVLERQ